MNVIPLSLYIHFPWCERKCPYCDFNSHEAKQDIPETEYIDALITDLNATLPLIWGRRIQTIFMGGGTPSIFSPSSIERLLKHIQQVLPYHNNTEITLEANPGTVEQGKLKDFRKIGINRLSIGIQSFDSTQLKHLGRIHTESEAVSAFHAARDAGFERINIDLMFGLIHQSTEAALADLQTGLSLEPDHLSWYQLTLEPNTLFHRYPPVLPDTDQLAEIQDQGVELLKQSGFEQYEVSAFAMPDRQCQHNLNYWNFGDYIGVGAGAHGKISNPDGTISRTFKPRQPKAYMQATLSNTIGDTKEIDPDDLPFEYALNALRLNQGFHINDFQKRTGCTRSDIAPTLLQAEQKKLIRADWSLTGVVRCTPVGWAHLNTLTELFLKS